MTHWTADEQASMKVILHTEWKMGKLRRSTPTVIIRPARMEPKDFKKLIELVAKYGKTR